MEFICAVDFPVLTVTLVDGSRAILVTELLRRLKTGHERESLILTDMLEI